MRNVYRFPNACPPCLTPEFLNVSVQDIIGGKKLFTGYDVRKACREQFSAVDLSKRPGDTTPLECYSTNTSVIQAAFTHTGNCKVFFQGTETRGGDVDVVVKYFDKHISRVPFRVWYPESLSIVSSDHVLQPITYLASGSCPAMYQSSRLQAVATFSGPVQAPALSNIDVTDNVKFKVLNPQPSLISITGSTVERKAGFVSADVGCEGPKSGPCGTAKTITITGHSKKVSVQEVVVWFVSETQIERSIQLAADAGTPPFEYTQTIHAFATLTSRLTTAGDSVTVFARARFSDGTWSHSLTKAMGLSVTSNEPCVEVTDDGNRFRLKIPDDPFECYGKNVLSIEWIPRACNGTVAKADNVPAIRIPGREAIDRYIGVTGLVAVRRQVVRTRAALRIYNCLRSDIREQYGCLVVRWFVWSCGVRFCSGHIIIYFMHVGVDVVSWL